MTGYTVIKEVEFCAGHRVPSHAGKCRHPHGHQYRVRAHVHADALETHGPATGMVVDFGSIKSLLVELVHDRFDHAFIMHDLDEALRKAFEIDDDNESATGWNVVVVPWVPTAENIAGWCFVALDARLTREYGSQLQLRRVDVWETPTSCATVERTP